MPDVTFWLDEDEEHFWYSHFCDSPEGHWARSERFSEATLLPLGPEGWMVTSHDPLTITPSILCRHCGCHGFITAGEWIPC